MSVKWERDSDAPKGTLTFDIDTETIQKGIDHAFTRTQKRISVPGFRRATFRGRSSTKCTGKNPSTKML